MAAQVPQGTVDREMEAQIVHGGKNLPLSFMSLASAKHVMVTRLLLNVCCLCVEGLPKLSSHRVWCQADIHACGGHFSNKWRR